MRVAPVTPQTGRNCDEQAYRTILSGKLFKINVIDANSAEEKIAGRHGKPASATTSREHLLGRRTRSALAYGNVECQKTATCAIHMIDLMTGRESTVQDSEGLDTARWSPNGRFIAALRPAKQEVLVFDVGARKWWPGQCLRGVMKRENRNMCDQGTMYLHLTSRLYDRRGLCALHSHRATQGNHKGDWQERKEAYIERLRGEPRDAQLISAFSASLAEIPCGYWALERIIGPIYLRAG